MAAWRRAIELSLGEADTAKLRSIAQSRTEPASRVERARILLAYREDPSFFAVGRALGLHLLIPFSCGHARHMWESENQDEASAAVAEMGGKVARKLDAHAMRCWEGPKATLPLKGKAASRIGAAFRRVLFSRMTQGCADQNSSSPC